MSRLLLLDNFDSFTYNLVHLLRELGQSDFKVVRNNALSIADAEQFDSIVLSPGPGIPSESGIMPELVRHYSPTKKILGVCLGHQCIGEVFGAKLINLANPVHGKSVETKVLSTNDKLFDSVNSRFMSGRYHSWAIDKKGLPDSLEVTAEDAEGIIMAIRHKEHNVRGVQFHPESVLTEHGATILKNWLGL